MKWVRDHTGRFEKRPHYERGELDLECEKLVASFLKRKYGAVEFPISTEDLCLLVEKCVDDLEPYADLPEDTFGVTVFTPGKKPKVKISRALSENPRMANPFRTTLTHELGHVTFHSFLFDLSASTPSLFEDASTAEARQCLRQNIIAASTADWMEWQAGYACGATLMPLTPLRNLLDRLLELRRPALPLPMEAANGLVQEVVSSFSVSVEAAKVRLSQLGYITDKAVSLPIHWC